MIECWDEDPKQRPTFDQILFMAKKNSMKIDLGRSPTVGRHSYAEFSLV